ncbi:MAG: YitT family protein [Vulcanibacillus sp.]
MKGKYRFLRFINKAFFIVLGVILVSIGLEVFLIPNNIIDGGVVGISIILSYLTEIPLGIYIFIINIPFLIVGYREIGKSFVLTALSAIILLSLSVTYFESFPSMTNDVLLASVFGGILIGIGVGIIIRNNGSLDGTEIIAIILDRKTGFSVGEIVMFFNLFILSSAGFVFGWDRAMYSLITYFIAYKMIDITVEGLDESKAVIIISDKYEEIINLLMKRLGRGVTLLNGKGGYSGTPRSVVYVVISRLEVAKLKSVVYNIDDNALITISSVEVIGKRYKKKAIH